MDPYIKWLLRNDKPVFEMGGTWWCRYHQGLVPALVKPAPLQLTPQQEKELLRKSGSLFLRYFTRTFDEPTSFWYTACCEYDPQRVVKSSVRRQLRRAYERCTVQRIDPAWLASNGYDCYAAAFARYRNAWPVSRQSFQADCMHSIGGPFEFWGVFVDDKLAGFAKCVVGTDYVAVLVSKLHPEYLSLYSAYALRDTLLKTYVADLGKTVGGGFRPIAHKTAMHDFLLKFGYRRIHCDLRVVYQPVLRALVSLTYPFKALVDLVPAIGPASSAQILLAQEEIRRSFVKQSRSPQDQTRHRRSYV